MHAIQKKNRHAFEVLYMRYFERLSWYVHRMINDMHSAEDIVQEVFMKIVSAPEKFDTDKKFSTWVYTVSGNMAKNHLRKNKQQQMYTKHQQVTLNGVVHNKHETEKQVLQKQLDNVYTSLNEKEKTLFVLRFEQHLSIFEIAEIMQIPEGSVKSGLFYLLKKYRPLIQHFSYEN